jgi:hypothetical protein
LSLVAQIPLRGGYGEGGGTDSVRGAGGVVAAHVVLLKRQPPLAHHVEEFAGLPGLNKDVVSSGVEDLGP